MRRLALRTRLTVLYGGLFLIAGAASLAVIYLRVQQRLEAELRGDAESRIEVLREQAAAEGGTTITGPDGSILSIDELVDQAQADRVAVKDAALDALLVRGGIVVVVIGVIAAAIGWCVAGRGLRPLHAITETAERIASARGIDRDLSERIALTGRDDDIKRLADSFDAMLDSLNQAFHGQRQFVAGASHELRTPLALQRALIELEMTRPGATPESRHFAESLLRTTDRHSRLIDRLLFLADSENEVEHPVPVDLHDVAASVLASIPDADVHDLTIGSSLGPATALGDPILLEQLVRNLVENAVRHNVPGGWSSITTSTDAGRAVLRFVNSGPRVAQHDVDGLCEPFRRNRATPPTSGTHIGRATGRERVHRIHNNSG
jgi:signal transduction histidine kinase